MQKSLVSVIVPTYNSEVVIENCLRSVANQTYRQIELIVVDNYSTDQTRQISQQYTDKVFKKGPERCSQRNYGLELSCGEYVVFIDSDMILSKTVISEAVNMCMTSSPPVEGVYIPEISIGEGFWTACKALERSCYIGDESIEAARFFKKKALLATGGYDENLISAEDWDLSKRFVKAGHNLGHINSVIEHDEGKLDLFKTIKKKYYYGQKINAYLGKHKKTIKTQFSPLRLSYIRNWRGLLKDPLHCAGFVIMKFCEFSAGGLGLFQAMIEQRFKAER